MLLFEEADCGVVVTNLGCPAARVLCGCTVPRQPCGWPPWQPNGAEQGVDSDHVHSILESFFEKDFNASESVTGMRPCLDQSVTPLRYGQGRSV